MGFFSWGGGGGGGGGDMLAANNLSDVASKVISVENLFVTTISPPALAGSVNNYNPTGLSTAMVIDLTTDLGGPYNITGIVGGADGRILILRNLSSRDNIVLAELTGSIGGNQFNNGGNFTLGPNGQSCVLQYDGGNSKWRVIGSCVLVDNVTLDVSTAGYLEVKQIAHSMLPNMAAHTFLANSTSGSATPTDLTVAQSLALLNDVRAVSASFSSPVVGSYVDVIVPYAGTIQSATTLVDAGTITVDVRRCTYAQFDSGATHPVSGDTLCSATPPTVTSGGKAQDTTLSSWTTSIAAGDILRFYVTAVASATQCSVELKVLRTA